MAPSKDAVYTKLGSVDIETEQDPYIVSDDDVTYDDDNTISNRGGIKFACLETPLLDKKPSRSIRGNKKNNVRGACMTCCIITLIVVGLLLAIMVGFAVAGYMWMANQVGRWSVDTPNPNIPMVVVPLEELEVFKDRAKLFFDLVQSGKTGGVDTIDDLIVTARAVNGFATSSDYLRHNLFATLSPNQIVVDVSLPLEGILPGGKGRYIVGTETLTWDPTTKTIHDQFVPRPDDQLPQPAYWDLTFNLTQMNFDDDDDVSVTGKVYNLEIVKGQFLDWVIPQDFIDEHVNLLDGFYHCDCDDDGCKVMHRLLDSMTAILLQQDQVVFQAEPVSALSSMMRGNHHNNKMMKMQPNNHHGRSLRAGSDDTNNSKSTTTTSTTSNWKFKVARRLVGL